jgi:peptidyl-prolyl cis-trans isomerase D
MIQGLTVAIKESILLKSFLGVLMISFAVWGVGDAINPALDPNVVIKVDQVEIRAEELQRRFNMEVNQLREALGPDFTAKQAADLGIMDNVIIQLSQGASLDMAARSLGLTIPDDALRRAIADQDAFKDETGNFNRLMFDMSLSSNNLTEQGFIDLIRSDITRQSMLQPVTENTGAPKRMVDALFLYRAEQRMADVIYIDDAKVKLGAEPSDQDLRTVYNENISSFTAPEYREISAIYVRPKDLVPPESITQEEIQTFYDENIDRYRTQPTRSVNQLIFSTQFEAQTAYDQVQDGDTLASLGERAGLGAPIELGTLRVRDNIGFDLESIFVLDQNTVSTPIQTDFGWHLFEVTDMTVGSISALPVVRQDIIDFIVEDRAFDEMYEATVYLEDQLAAGIPIKDVAAAPGYNYLYFESVDRDGRDSTGAPVTIPVEQDRFLRLAFSTEESLDSRLIETDEYAYILRVESVIEPAPKPYDRVKDDVPALWESQLRSMATATVAASLLNDIGPATNFADLAEEDENLLFVKLGPVTRFGNSLRLDAIIPARYISPEGLDRMFRTRVGDVIEARVAEGHVVARLVEIVPPDETSLTDARKQVEDAVRQSIANELAAEFTNAVTEAFDVTLNREIIDQITPQ